MTNQPNQPEESRLDRIEKIVESNAKAIQALGDQAATDREQARLDREAYQETREDIRALGLLIRELYETTQAHEQEIRMQSGEIQNLADSIQNLYSRQPPSGTQ